MMLVLNAESFCKRHDQVLFVQLRVALEGLVIGSFRDFAQVGERFVFEFFDCVCHRKLLLTSWKSLQRSDRDDASYGPGNRGRNNRAWLDRFCLPDAVQSGPGYGESALSLN